MKTLIRFLSLFLLVTTLLTACTPTATPSDTTAGEQTSGADTTAPAEETDSETVTETPTEETTEAPEEPADILNTFTSNLASAQAGTALDQTDLASGFTISLGGDSKTTATAYTLDGTSEMYTDVKGFYALRVNFGAASTGSAYAFVRGARQLISADGTPVIGAYCDSDGSDADLGGAGIYAKLQKGVLTLVLKLYDETAPSHVRNVCYTLRCIGTELTMADSGETVSVLVDGITFATVALSGSSAYDGLTAEPATEFAAEATVSLRDGTTETLTNTLIDSDFRTQVGMASRAGVLSFTSAALLTYTAAEVMDLTVVTPTVTDITKMPDFKVSGVFGSYMVLQREKPITIWGFSNTKDSVVTGTFDGETVTGTVDENGRWELVFSARPANKVGQTITISDDRGHSATLEDVLIGDVWLVGGQSNAELNLSPCISYTPEMTIDASDPIRLFSQTQAYTVTQQEACKTPQYDVLNPAWKWKRADRSAALSFSAIGYFFAKEVSARTDVPQGVIMMAAGGSCLSELMSPDLAHKQGYRNGALVCEGGYFNALIHPFIGMACKGMLFFQGESEGGQKPLASKYAKEMTLLIEEERVLWGQNFPVYYVQLSDYRSEGTQYFPYHDVVRVQQFDALSTIPNSTMVVAMDLGAPEGYSDWAHSPRKYELGQRLANAALAKEYGIGDFTKVTSPMPVKVTLSEDKTKITIEFENVGDGLTVYGLSPEESIGKSVAGFSVGRYPKNKETTATITSKNTVVVDVPSGTKNPAYVNYAHFMLITTENANLYGSNGLPAPAFTLKLD